MELFRGSIMRAQAKAIKEHANGIYNELIAFNDEVMKGAFKIKFEGLEDGYKLPKCSCYMS